MTLDAVVHVTGVVVLVLLFSALVGWAVGTWLEDNSECDELPSRQRVTPEPPRVRLCPFDQDAAS